MTTFDSVYSMFDNVECIRKQRFWCWFDGACLDSRWTENDVQGTGIFKMVPIVDRGFEVDSGSTNDDTSEIDFNGIEQFDDSASVLIGLFKRTSTFSGVAMGMQDGTNLGGTVDKMVMRDDTDDSFKEAITNDGTCETQTSTGVALDNNYHTYKIEATSSSTLNTVDGILRATITATIPNSGKLSPAWLVVTRTTSAKFGEIRFMEAYNT